MLHFECKHSTLQNHKTNKHEKGLEFQTEPNPARDLSTANPTTLPPGLAFFKQENVNMVIFSTCSKTDRFSQAGRKKKGKTGPHTIPGLPTFTVCSCLVLQGCALRLDSVCKPSRPDLPRSKTSSGPVKVSNATTNLTIEKHHINRSTNLLMQKDNVSKD